MFTKLQDYVAERIYRLGKLLDKTVIYYYSLHLRRLNIFSKKFAEKSNGLSSSESGPDMKNNSDTAAVILDS